MGSYLIFVIFASTTAIAYAFYLITWILKQDEGSPKMKEIASAIRSGSKLYLNRQYRVIAVVALIIFGLLWSALTLAAGFGFVVGAAASAIAGYIGMNIAVQTNVRTAQAANHSTAKALEVAIRGGTVTGLTVTGLALLVVSMFWYFSEDIASLLGLALGGSLISIFARLGGGIFTKAADIGADLAGKVESGMLEDDPQNPAVIADNVGDNVGDCAGMAADLFETYLVTAIAAILLGEIVFEGFVDSGLYPLTLGGVAALSALIGSFVFKLGKKRDVMAALYRGLAVAGLLSVVAFYFVTDNLMSANGLYSTYSLFAAAFIGVLITIGMVLITDYSTSTKYKPVREIALASKFGHGSNIISGLTAGMKSTALPVLLVATGIVAAYTSAELYGVAIAAMGMLSMAGIIITIDAYGPITDNASAIAQMAKLSKATRKRTQELDAVGNTTKAITKGYAIASAGLAALVLFTAFTKEISVAHASEPIIFALSDPYVLVGLFIGGLLPYYFGALVIEAVSKSAVSVVAEVRRQVKKSKNKSTPDYNRVVDILSKSAIRRMILPALLPIVVPIAVFFVGNAVAEDAGFLMLGGLLVGAIVTGLFVAISMTNSGGAWDNAKKYLEQDSTLSKSRLAREAVITGDIVGDPYKDAAGPAINPMVKVLNVVALLLVAIML